MAKEGPTAVLTPLAVSAETAAAMFEWAPDTFRRHARRAGILPIPGTERYAVKDLQRLVDQLRGAGGPSSVSPEEGDSQIDEFREALRRAHSQG